MGAVGRSDGAQRMLLLCFGLRSFVAMCDFKVLPASLQTTVQVKTTSGPIHGQIVGPETV